MFFIVLAVMFSACQPGQLVTYNVAITPVQPLQPAAQKVLVLNTFDPTLYAQRKNKQSLVAQLTDTLLKQMSAQIEQSGLQVVPQYGVTPVFSNADEGSILNLIKKNNATHAIVITEVDVYFDQTGVEVTKTQNGKSREAFYDICSKISYALYNDAGKIEARTVPLRKAHSSRSVISGVLAAGPALASNKEAFYKLASDNKNIFLHQYFPIFVTRQRSLFTKGAFKLVGNALAHQNYETALKESLLLTESSSREIKAKAYYNCAVLTERLQNEGTAQKYLQQSLWALRLPQAVEMQYSLNN